MALSVFNLAEQLADKKQQGLYRQRRVIDSPQSTEIVVDGKKVLNFCSNDYLGLANHPALIAAIQKAAAQYGTGSGSAHLICGHSREHHALEEELAAFTGRDRALLFSTGYMANLGVIAGLLGRGDTVLEDRLNHASLIDGGLLSGAKFQRYRHADSSDLAAKLAKREGKTLIVSDGVFSMDGDIAPLPALVELANTHQAGLMIDDAHGLGVLGANGGGVLQHYGLTQDDVPILMGTLGKAFGTFGAFVAGSDALIETLIQQARTYIFTTAMPAPVAAATRASLQLVQAESWRRDKLQQLISHFRKGAKALDLPLMDSPTAIQPLLIGDNQQALAVSEALFAQGFWVSAIRPPTVPKGQARLRVTLSAGHEVEQVDRLLNTLNQTMNSPASLPNY